MGIIIENITKIYGKQKALDNVSLQIEQGKITGFLGPNGAGKSTLMKIITGYIPPNEGNVKINSLNVLENSMSIRKILGYLPENNPLYLDMYISEYLSFVASLYKITNKNKRIKEIIEITGLTPEKNKKIGSLSKGYRQRVGLAQAIIHNPKILILDEPTSGLDPIQIIEIRNLIKNLGKEKTVMLSTHIMQEAEAICNNIIIINKGKIVASNNRDKIHNLGKDNFASLFVEFANTINESEIKKIKGIVKIEKIQNNNYILTYNQNIDIRQDIFNFAVKNNNVILSQQLKERSLEDVFVDLTL